MAEIVNQAWVVIPAYQEAKVLRRVVAGVRGIGARVVVVDDGSSDRTTEEALAAGATVLRHAVNLGQGAALQTGIDYALARGASYVFTFDADGQHAPEFLLILEAALQQTGADVVLGSRTLGKAVDIPMTRKLLLKAALAFTRLQTTLPVTDTHNGLRLFTRNAASRIRIRHTRMAHASEILSQIRELGLRFVEAPVTVQYTDYSLTKGQKITGAFQILADILYAAWCR
jgi:glycosyltransferase involved in cell wall biosynthesis